MTLNDSHYTRARFTVLVSCSDELAVHSCPLFSCIGRLLRNWQAGCFFVDLYCVTITWQQIFKGSVQVTIAGVRVANLAFLKPDFEILAFFEHLWVFLDIKKPDKIWRFSVGKAWFWKIIV